jgi:hypothetical protein
VIVIAYTLQVVVNLQIPDIPPQMIVPDHIHIHRKRRR